MVVQATLSLFGSFFILLLAGVPISAGIGIASVVTALFSMPADIFALIAAQRCSRAWTPSRCWPCRSSPWAATS